MLFFFQAEDGIRDRDVTGVQTCALPISEEKLLQMAHFDQLTGLANRTLFLDRLDQALAQAKRHKQGLVVLFLDLDGFKAVNDNLGHKAGDVLLREAGQRLAANVREVDTVARMGGEIGRASWRERVVMSGAGGRSRRVRVE